MFRTLRHIALIATVTTLMLGGGIALISASPASAADTVFVVNDAGDFPLNGNIGVCESTNIIDEVGTCTLRAAVEAAKGLETPVT
ncbi:MAG TPA: hypothetical protein VGG09_01105, partial [Acidimicrobiales bacterium]